MKKYQCRITWDSGEEWFYFNSSFDKKGYNSIGLTRINSASYVNIYPPRNVPNEFFLKDGKKFRKYGPITFANNGRENYE